MSANSAPVQNWNFFGANIPTPVVTIGQNEGASRDK